MPELPEVETVKRHLQAQLQNHTITSIKRYTRNLRKPIPESLHKVLKNVRMLDFTRRGKYILTHLSNQQILLFHLGMSGRLIIDKNSLNQVDLPQVHEHFTLYTKENERLSFIDPRRFGLIDIFPKREENTHPLLKHLGYEPFPNEPQASKQYKQFLIQYLFQNLGARKQSIKNLLLNQQIIAGLGNIYACEALFRAKISPLRSANTITLEETILLVQAIQQTLSDAIVAGGSSMKDYVHLDGKSGYFQMVWNVYGREGETCLHCQKQGRKTFIRRVIQVGRSSFFCPFCQQ